MAFLVSCMADSARPVFVMLGGPNGAGKSTTAKRVTIGEFVNPDVVAKRINPQSPDAAALPAAREVLKQLKTLKEQSLSFTYETTLSSNDSLRQIDDAKAKGYEVRLYFVALADADTSARRVAFRVSQGGHDIPADALMRRFELTFANAVEAAANVDRFELIDNQNWKSETILIIENNQIVARHTSEHPRIQLLLEQIIELVSKPK
jgi:predicted ABC-type ATPase